MMMMIYSSERLSADTMTILLQICTEPSVGESDSHLDVFV